MNDILKEAMGELQDEVILMALEDLAARIKRANAFKEKMDQMGIQGRGGPIYDISAQLRISKLIQGETIANAVDVERRYAAQFLGAVVKGILAEL